jgi:hypothetical protein
MEFSSRPLPRLLCAGLLAAASSGAHAIAVNSTFQPNDQTVNFFNVQGASNTDLQLAMFDDLDTGFTGSLLNIAITGDVASFDPTIGQAVDYTVTNNNSDTLTLLGSDQFILGLRDAVGGTFGWTQPTDVTCTATTNSCTASWSVAGTTELVVDVQLAPVPVPAAAWLFGSGLLGLTMVGRRRAK